MEIRSTSSLRLRNPCRRRLAEIRGRNHLALPPFGTHTPFEQHEISTSEIGAATAAPATAASALAGRAQREGRGAASTRTTVLLFVAASRPGRRAVGVIASIGRESASRTARF
jgi:hypothetical protein